MNAKTKTTTTTNDEINMNPLQLISIHDVVFIKHDWQFAGYQKRIEEWLKTWSADGNFYPCAVEIGDHPPALLHFATRFLDWVETNFNHLIPAWAIAQYDFRQDFEFEVMTSAAFVAGTKDVDLQSRKFRIALANIAGLPRSVLACSGAKAIEEDDYEDL